VADICPRCGSDDIFGKKFGAIGNASIYERKCQNCGLFEYKSNADKDFDEWYARWHKADDDSDEDEAKAKAKAEDEDEDENEVVAAPDIKPVIAAPDDDRPRLAYARGMEKLRPERAEFIRLQIERADAERRSRATISQPGPREIELRAKFGAEWAGAVSPYGRPYASTGKFRGYDFERGFVAYLRTDPDIVIDPKSRLFELAPITYVELTADGPWQDAMLSPVVARLRGLGLARLGMTNDDARRLAENGHLERLEWLDLRGNKIGSPGVHALLDSPVIRAIPVVLLAGNPVDPAMQYSRDYDGSVMDQFLPKTGEIAESKHGRVNWLHLPAEGAPDVFLARNAKYVD
jgi:uncharacterized protein (TIGR02996 family)